MSERSLRPSFRAIAEAYRRSVWRNVVEPDMTADELAAALRDRDELMDVFGPIRKPEPLAEGETDQCSLDGGKSEPNRAGGTTRGRVVPRR